MRNWSQRARPTDKANVFTIPFIIGGTTVALTTGIQACLPIFFNGWITGIQIQEFDGTFGSATLDVFKFVGSATPLPVSIITPGGGTRPFISGRFFQDYKLLNWDTKVSDGDYIEISLVTVSSFKRLSIALRFRKQQA